MTADLKPIEAPPMPPFLLGHEVFSNDFVCLEASLRRRDAQWRALIAEREAGLQAAFEQRGRNLDAMADERAGLVARVDLLTKELRHASNLIAWASNGQRIADLGEGETHDLLREAERLDALSQPAAAPVAAQPEGEPMSERDHFDFARWQRRLGELADAYYEAGRTNPARHRARAALMLHATDCATGWRARSALAATTPTAATEAAPGRMSDEMRSFIEGMSVSVDVSTCEEDAGHRYFGTVTEVMDDSTDKHGVTLLVQNAEPNFEPAAAPVDQAVIEKIMDLVIEYRHANERNFEAKLIRQQIEVAIRTALTNGGRR